MEGQEGTLCSAVGSSATAEQKRGATTQKDYIPKNGSIFQKIQSLSMRVLIHELKCNILSPFSKQLAVLFHTMIGFSLSINCMHDSMFIYYRCFVRSVWVLGGEALYTVTGRLLKRRDWTGERAKYLAMKWKWFSGSQWQSLQMRLFEGCGFSYTENDWHLLLARHTHQKTDSKVVFCRLYECPGRWQSSVGLASKSGHNSL